jgi:hypothetical protein
LAHSFRGFSPSREVIVAEQRSSEHDSHEGRGKREKKRERERERFLLFPLLFHPGLHPMDGAINIQGRSSSLVLSGNTLTDTPKNYITNPLGPYQSNQVDNKNDHTDGFGIIKKL